MIPTKENTYCFHPFNQITLKDWSPQGLITSNPCCQMSSGDFGKKLAIDGIKSKNPIEIFNDTVFQKLRDDLLNGVKTDVCKTCWKMEENGFFSFRLYSKDKDLTDDVKLQKIDLTLSNNCNLSCRMCSPYSSHKLLVDEKKMRELNIKTIFEKSIGRAYEKPKVMDPTNSPQFKWLEKNTDKITKLMCSGGEPFYDKKLINLLKKYVKNDDAKNTLLEFHTNATMFSDEIVDLQSNFKGTSHVFSIDGVDSVYEYIRNYDFHLLEKSVLNFLQKCRNINIVKINLVLSSLNVLNVNEWEEWIKFVFNSTKNEKKFHTLISQVYPFERGTSIRNLPISILKEARNRTNHFQLLEFIDYAINNNKENKQKMLDEIKCLDVVRGQNFKDYVDPILSDWLK